MAALESTVGSGPLVPSAPAAPGIWDALKRWSDRVGSIKTLLAVVMAVGATGTAAYQHFATMADLRKLEEKHDTLLKALTCELQTELEINAIAVDATGRIQKALQGLSNVDKLDDLLAELKSSMGDVDDALDSIKRARTAREQRAVGGKPCVR